MIFRILFSHGHKVLLMHQATNPNLGDQAQRLCTLHWIKRNYPDSQCLEIGDLGGTLSLTFGKRYVFTILACQIKILCLKLKVKDSDLFLGHSGYFMIDHHSGWKMFTNMMRYFPNNKMLILPQTINFYTPFIKKYVAECFSKDKNVTLMCRDEVSFQIGQQLFPNTRLLLFPDIVTSLVGSKQYSTNRNGILFCMRDDVEAFYTPEQIAQLMSRFGNIRKTKTDTTLHGITQKMLDKNREKLIWDFIDEVATYKVVVTDRYHGTIFSVIASTPVVVINSADHKLSSGVHWFPKEIFGEYVQFAQNLNEAFEKVQQKLHSTETYCAPPYFKEKYWDCLKQILENN